MLAKLGADFLAEAGALAVRFQRGWSRDTTLGDALRAARPRDAILGHTTVGPHRADWSVGYELLPTRETFSRGQEKLTALACILAQGRGLARAQGHWPLVALDDLASELDAAHQSQVLAAVLASGAQVVLTGTQAPAGIPDAHRHSTRTFHVERGVIEAH